MEEIFKDINGYEGYYQVSNFGRVKSINYMNTGKENILRPSKHKSGYLSCHISFNGSSKTYRIHRLVCMAFLPNPENKPQVNHKNGIKTDNNIENLEWATNEENQRHAVKKGLHIERKGKKIRRKFHSIGGSEYGGIGSKCIHSKPVEQYTLDNVFVKSYSGASEADRQTGIYYTSILKCCNGIYKSAGGYIWKHKQPAD